MPFDASTTWSVTRAKSWSHCRRQFYYRYALAPRARQPDSPAEALEADRVRGLIGVDAWAGEVVHEVIRAVLNRWRAGRGMPEPEAIEYGVRLLRRQFRDSGEYWSAPVEAFPRRPTLLDLHYYREETLGRQRAGELKERVAEAVRQFLRSPLALRIGEVGPARWLPIDRNAAARLDNGILILVKPDFAYRDGDRLHIVDWKTGRPDASWEGIQLACYARYAAEKWGQPPEEVEASIVYLYPEFTRAAVECGPAAVATVEHFIAESHAEISAALAGEPSLERFPVCEDAGRCRWCPFRGLCDGARRWD